MVIASVGTHSGPLGEITYSIVQGAQVWVKVANAKGGLNGHRIKFLTYDDGGDPARHRSLVQRAIEQDGAVAFLANTEVLTGGPSVKYLEFKRVPVIGVDLGENWPYESPIYFPQGTVGDALIYMSVAGGAQQLVPLGKKKLASIVCVEADQCKRAEGVIAKHAPKEGFVHVYQARTSLAQPDFTAECLAARNADAQVLLVFLDANSIGRIASSCARQNYKPTFAISASLITLNQTKDPNLVGSVGINGVFPWFQTGTPATDEYHEAMRLQGAGLQQSVGLTDGWVAGKVLEKAGPALSEPPTSESILRGLWSIKNDTLGGLTQPLTFVENQPPKPLACWFNMAIRDKAWVSPDAFQQRCLPFTFGPG